VEQISLSPDGSFVISNGTEETLTKWDINTGEVLERSPKKNVGSVQGQPLCFSEDRQRLAMRSQGFVDVVAVAGAIEERVRLPEDGAPVYGGAFSPDNSLLALIGKDSTVRIWQLRQAGQSRVVFRGHTGEVHAATFSPDGRRVASGNTLVHEAVSGEASVKPRAKLSPPSQDKGLVKVWDVASGQVVHSLEHAGPVWGVSFRGDGKLLASACGDHNVWLWDLTTGQSLPPLVGHGDIVYAVAFSPAGGELASASRDKTVRIWDLTTGKPRLPPLARHVAEVYSVAYSPDGKRLATAGADKTAKVWDVATGKELHHIPVQTEVESIVFSSDGASLATGGRDGVVTIWDAVSGEQRNEFRGHTDGVTSVAFTPDGQRLASAGADNTVRLWRVTTGQELLVLRDHAASVECVAFSRDGHRLVSASEDRTVRVWDGTPVPDPPAK
jgi:WD40 repeat protein